MLYCLSDCCTFSSYEFINMTLLLQVWAAMGQLQNRVSLPTKLCANYRDSMYANPEVQGQNDQVQICTSGLTDDLSLEDVWAAGFRTRWCSPVIKKHHPPTGHYKVPYSSYLFSGVTSVHSIRLSPSNGPYRHMEDVHQ